MSKKNQKIKIVQLEGNAITQKFEIDSASDFSSFNEEIKKVIKDPYDIYILKNKMLRKINKEIYNKNPKKSKEFFLVKNENIHQSEISAIYDKLEVSTQEDLDEKTCCSICLNRLNKKPYYCYKCHKLYCDNCFKKLKIVKKKKCEKCNTDSICVNEICEKCHENHEIEYAMCCQCFFFNGKK